MSQVMNRKESPKIYYVLASIKHLWRSRKAFGGSKLLTDYRLAPMTPIWDTKLYTKWLDVVLGYVYYLSANVA
ncbi:hypothetical protein OUZ56_026214 [Daphnia magna]|uniref:Uncharacterized protein n=1 Tax=Daphnia magna TaxID=35525 RepID=A0ABQ9ZL75_9CRUS|nr:hypothetical protein OUZ56_026214 [Daphnia magna]